jgi:hypothetical protein
MLDSRDREIEPFDLRLTADGKNGSEPRAKSQKLRARS